MARRQSGKPAKRSRVRKNIAAAEPKPEPAPLAMRLAGRTTYKIIGLGGIGGTLARYVCLLLSAAREAVRVVLIDGDEFDPSANASRMFFSRAGNKAEVLRDELLAQFQQTSLAIVAIPEFITADNAARLLRSGDVVIVCVDNHATRKLVSDACAGDNGWPGLADACVISGGNDGVGPDSSGVVRRGTYGTVQVHVRRDGVNLSPPLTEFHPEIHSPADKLPTELSCLELAASVPQIVPANLQAAAAMLSTLWLYLCDALPYGELAFDIALGQMRPAPIPTALVN